MDEPLAVQSVMEWVERLGGWAVVLIVVRWMMSRSDQTVDGMADAIARFRSFEDEEKDVHHKITSTQDTIAATVQSLGETTALIARSQDQTQRSIEAIAKAVDRLVELHDRRGN